MKTDTPGDVGREEVGVALDPRQLGAERGGERRASTVLPTPGTSSMRR